jgi:hypothetical protein
MESTTCNNPVIRPPVITWSKGAGRMAVNNLEPIDDLTSEFDVSAIVVLHGILFEKITVEPIGLTIIY